MELSHNHNTQELFLYFHSRMTPSDVRVPYMLLGSQTIVSLGCKVRVLSLEPTLKIIY